MTAAELHELFDVMWNVIDVRVSVDRRTGMLRGFAHAEFLNVESAKAGFEYLSPKLLYGRHLRLDYSHTNKRIPGPGGQGSSDLEAPVFTGPSYSAFFERVMLLLIAFLCFSSALLFLFL